MEIICSHTSRNFSGKNLIILSLLALISGAVIYSFLRPAEAGFLSWFSSCDEDSWLCLAREKTLFLNEFLPGWMLYSLPDGLWAFAYTLIILSIWNDSVSMVKYVWYMSIPLLIFGFELLQRTGHVQGTFCLSDIVFSAAGMAAGFLTANANKQYNFIHTFPNKIRYSFSFNNKKNE